jgi:hypothetical protein
LFLSIQVTLAVVFPVLPAKSWKLKVYIQFPVKVYCILVHIIVSLQPVRDATTFHVVFHVVLYVTLQIGASLSIQVTVAGN